MADKFEEIVRDSERLAVVYEYVDKCMNSKYQVIDKEILCLLLGIHYKERRIEE